MKIKFLSFLVMICLLIGSFITPASARALTLVPQKITFLNKKGLMLEGWLFKPAGDGPYPAILMMHGCLGVYAFGDPTRDINSLYREWGNRLVNAGYVVLLVDSFTPRNVPQNQCGSGGGLSEVYLRPTDAYAGLNYLATQTFVDSTKVGLLGWSNGGSAVMSAMDVTRFKTSLNFKAAVAFYPGCGLHSAYGGLTESTWKPYDAFLILHGSADTVVRAGVCRSRIDIAKTLGATDISFAIYPHVQHSFDAATKVDSQFTQYDVDAKIAADERTMLFFDKRLH
jgi:dienelactone hydrolase